MTKMFMTFYYFLMSSIMFRSADFYFNENLGKPDFILFAKPLSFFTYSESIFPLLFIVGIIILCAAIFYHHWSMRIAASLSFLILLSMRFSFGKINHAQHIWMISSLLMCFMLRDKPLEFVRNKILIRIIQAALLSQYFITGLWKVRLLDFNYWSSAVLEHISYSIAQGRGPNLFIKDLLLVEFPIFVKIGFILVILFQIMSFIPIVCDRFFQFWGILAIAFHFSTGAILGIWFTPTILAVMFFLIVVEKMMSFEKSDLVVKP